MFRLTFLGHQGWLLTAAETRVLLDPLLRDEFGNGRPYGRLRVYPPRRIDFDAFPPIDAVIFSHEHEDHFNVPSLRRIDRRIPIYLSDRASTAARRIAEELGFEVHLNSPGRRFEIGRLSFLPLAQSMAGFHPGEWDTLALCARDLDGHGSFFTTVDHRFADITMRGLRRSGERPRLWTYPDNETDPAWQVRGAARKADATDDLARDLRDVWERSIPRDLRPELFLVVGNGMSFAHELSWMNRALYNRDPRGACERVGTTLAGRPFRAPLPGDTVVMERGRIICRDETVPFLSPLPCEQWPPHDAEGPSPPARFEPATGRYKLDDTGRATLAAALARLASFLYGTPVFTSLYEIDEAAPGGRKPVIALELLEGEDGSSTLWEYRPQDCRFVEVTGARPDQYLAGTTCWASDLLAVLELQLPPTHLVLGRMTSWNALPERFRFELPLLLFHYGHPLRYPDAFLRFYRRQAADFADDPLIRPHR